jgi:SRSO17 transposase
VTTDVSVILLLVANGAVHVLYKRVYRPEKKTKSEKKRKKEEKKLFKNAPHL